MRTRGDGANVPIRDSRWSARSDSGSGCTQQGGVGSIANGVGSSVQLFDGVPTLIGLRAGPPDEEIDCAIGILHFAIVSLTEFAAIRNRPTPFRTESIVAGGGRGRGSGRLRVYVGSSGDRETPPTSGNKKRN
ncbi:Hypothetical protein CINCED_3A022010 [Cinara cedri]|uniref:Uncharacterized protein n=1 Tax=Cinara cedri TaxID=506608 RepID=A0A5E4MCV4_9HEMI|nr:Hypothetical protein CINCED_3A022010 [Cinara cedri]